MINPVTVHVQLTAQPERAGALRDMLCQALVAIRQSPGCQGARLLTDAEQPDRILLVEQWASVQRHEEHVQSLVDGTGDAREAFERVWDLLAPGGRMVILDAHTEKLSFQGRMVNLTARADIRRG